MHYRHRQPIQVVDEPAGIEHHVDVARPRRVVVVQDRSRQQIVGDRPTLQRSARDRIRYAGKGDELFGNHGLKSGQVDPGVVDDVVGQVEIGMIVALDQPPFDAELALDPRDDRIFIPFVG